MGNFCIYGQKLDFCSRKGETFPFLGPRDRELKLFYTSAAYYVSNKNHVWLDINSYLSTGLVKPSASSASREWFTKSGWWNITDYLNIQSNPWRQWHCPWEWPHICRGLRQRPWGKNLLCADISYWMQNMCILVENVYKLHIWCGEKFVCGENDKYEVWQWPSWWKRRSLEFWHWCKKDSLRRSDSLPSDDSKPVCTRRLALYLY